MEQIRYSRETIENLNNDTERLTDDLENQNHIDNANKIESLNKSMLGYQFDYIDRIRKNAISPLEEDEDIKKEKMLGFLLMDNTTLGRYIAGGYSCRRPKIDKTNSERWDNFNNARNSFVNYMAQKINFLEADRFEEFRSAWKDKVLELIEKEINDLGPFIEREREDDPREKIGLMNIDISNAGEFALNQGWVSNPFDQVVNIHLNQLYQQKDENGMIKNIYSGESLSKLAEKIVDECPYIKAIVAKSWIVSSPIGRRIGLSVDKINKQVSSGSGFWGQFINEKGEIKEDKIKKFIETGIPDYYNATGYMKVEDFLRKHLPKEKRGLIKLKDLSSRSLEFRKFLKEADNNIEKNLDKMSFEEILSFFNTNSDMVLFLNSEDGKKYLDLLKKTKELKIKISDQEGAAEVIKSWRAFKEEKENIYEEREVFIE